MSQHRSPACPQDQRRLILLGATAALAAPSLIGRAQAQSAPALQSPTPSQTEGPFYPVRLPADTDFDLIAQGSQRYTKGREVWLDGSVNDRNGRPVRGAVVEIWQCDESGHYHHPGDGSRADPAFQGFGRVEVGNQGDYRFRTIRPAPYTGRTPHIHVKVKLGTRELLTTQLYVEGDPGNERDSLWRRLSVADRAKLTVPFRAEGDTLRASFRIVVDA